VLRSVYGFDRDAVVNSLRAFLGLPSISAETPRLLMEALDRAEKGVDFADALHLGVSAGCDAMLTLVQLSKSGTRTAITQPSQSCVSISPRAALGHFDHRRPALQDIGLFLLASGLLCP